MKKMSTTLPLHNFPEEAPQDPSVPSLKHPVIKAKETRMKITNMQEYCKMETQSPLGSGSNQDGGKSVF